MKLNSPDSIKAAEEVFRNYNGSWTAARAAAHRDKNGVLVIPRRDPYEIKLQNVGPQGDRDAG